MQSTDHSADTATPPRAKNRHALALEYMQGMYRVAHRALPRGDGELMARVRRIVEAELTPMVERLLEEAPSEEDALARHRALDPAAVAAALLLMAQAMAWTERVHATSVRELPTPPEQTLRRRRELLRNLFNSVFDELDGTHTFVCSAQAWQRIWPSLRPMVLAELAAAPTTAADAHETCGESR